VSSGDNLEYRQTAEFTETGNLLKLRGYNAQGELIPEPQPVPFKQVHWGTHGEKTPPPVPHVHGIGIAGTDLRTMTVEAGMNPEKMRLIEYPAQGFSAPATKNRGK
jgi:hypothetical protein